MLGAEITLGQYKTAKKGYYITYYRKAAHYECVTWAVHPQSRADLRLIYVLAARKVTLVEFHGLSFPAIQ